MINIGDGFREILTFMSENDYNINKYEAFGWYRLFEKR